MSDFYSTQYSRKAFNAVTLESTNTNQAEIETKGMQKLAVAVSYTMGAAESVNTISVTLEQSPDGGTTWFPLSIDSTSTTSVLTNRQWDFTGTGKFDFIVDIAYEKMRISLKEAGVSANKGVATVYYTLSGE